MNININVNVRIVSLTFRSFVLLLHCRQGQTVDIDLLQRLSRMFLSLGNYRSKFELPMLIDSKRFYINEGQQLIQTYDTAQVSAQGQSYIKSRANLCIMILVHSFCCMWSVDSRSVLTSRVHSAIWTLPLVLLWCK